MSPQPTGWIPLWVRISHGSCLVVGGGQVASRKIKMLLEAGASSVEVVTREASKEVQALGQGERVRLRIKEVEKQDLKGASLVVVATDQSDVNQRVSQWAREMGLLCNVVDKPELCNVVFPAVLRRGRLEVAVSTGGSSPAMAARIRDEIGDCLKHGYELLLDLLAELRARIKKMDLPEERRLELLRALVNQEVMELSKKKDEKELRAILERRMAKALGGLGLEKTGSCPGE